MAKANDDHVVMYDGTGSHGNPPYTMECRHCGETYSPAIPIAVSDFLAMGLSFAKRHRDCKKREASDG